MGYRVKGTLKLPDGSPASNAEIEFISRKNFSPLVQELKSNILCGPSGAYDVTLEYGEYAVIVYPGGTYPAALGTIILAADTVAGLDLPTLLQQADWQPATPEYIQQIAQWLAEANASASATLASELAAKASENNAKASETTASVAATTATTKASEATTAASTATTKATEASSSASSALSSKDAAATSATTASAGASTATTKAGEAAASASAAKASETNAKTSETNAAASASNAVATLAGAVPNTRKVNGKALSADVVIGAGDIANVVGLVSSGAVIERGSNANGEYVKFADGTMICTGLGLQGVFSSPGTIYVVATYAAAFVEINSVATQVGFTDLGHNLPLTFSGPTAYNVTSKTVDLVSTNIGILSNGVFTQGNADITRFGYTATGRWK